ncbi:uncharacterized protein LOC135146592 [Zophobas morio]|uniref:uncharacterized protein LOC135146592 n=1 Tax=Zophobas morio TaxID=2755281 RepID=UPI0030838001
MLKFVNSEGKLMSDEGFEVFATLVIGVVNKHVISQMTNFRAKFIPDDPKVVDALSRFKDTSMPSFMPVSNSSQSIVLAADKLAIIFPFMYDFGYILKDIIFAVKLIKVKFTLLLELFHCESFALILQ